MSIELAYQYLFLSVLIVLGILLGIVLIRSIIGPRITDRILCINMIGTLVICMIAILSVRQKEGYLVDISLIYAMISFLSVLILASVYIRGKHSGSSEGQTEEAARLNDLMASDSIVIETKTADMSGDVVSKAVTADMSSDMTSEAVTADMSSDVVSEAVTADMSSDVVSEAVTTETSENKAFRPDTAEKSGGGDAVLETADNVTVGKEESHE